MGPVYLALYDMYTVAHERRVLGKRKKEASACGFFLGSIVPWILGAGDDCMRGCAGDFSDTRGDRCVGVCVCV